MTENFIEMTEDEFDDRYPLKSNHIDPAAGWAIGEAGGCLFGTYGEEFEFVRRQNPRTVWTWIDGDDGDTYLVSGLHFVNRIGYLISEIECPADTAIQEHLPMSPLEIADSE